MVAVLITVGLLSSACDMGAAQTPPTSPAAPGTSASGASPAPAVEPSPVPTSATGSGTVRGTLLHVTTNQPLTDDDGVVVYLAGVLNGDFRTAALDRATAPYAMLSKQGNFVFANVPPGEYAVALVTPTSEVLVHQPNDDTKDLIITVEADKTIELGTIKGKYP
jgi:hypothetical protein